MIRMKTGSSESAAVLRNSSSTGFSTSATIRYQPISRPSGTPIATAIAKPPNARTRLALVSCQSVPSLSRCHQAESTSESGGTKVLSTIPSSGRNCQTAASRISPAVDTTSLRRSRAEIPNVGASASANRTHLPGRLGGSDRRAGGLVGVAAEALRDQDLVAQLLPDE